MSNRLGPETKAIIEAIHNTENCPDQYQQGFWTIERIGKTNIYKVYITEEPRAIAMPAVAADVTTQLRIPFAHKWLRIHFYHTTAAYVVATTALRVTLRRAVGVMLPVQFLDELFCEFDITDVIMIEKFGEGFEYEAGTWNLILNTTATDLVFPLFYIEKLEP
jgi:hypothetical protein